MTGGTGNDSLSGAIENDSITGNGGNDSLFGGAGNDSLYGGAGSDSLVGSAEAATTVAGTLSWSALARDEASVERGVTTTISGMTVTVSFAENVGKSDFTVESTDTAYVAPGETFNATSNLEIAGPGNGQSTTTVNFAPVSGGGMEANVQNVAFRLNDIDVAGWQDRITVLAYDANGIAVPVTITASGNDLVSGSTITGTGTADSIGVAQGSALVQIAGPVARVEIVYSNLGTAGQIVFVSDVQFQAVRVDADLVSGGADNDTLLGGYGNDTLLGEDGNDLLFGGLGVDSLVGGAGNDTLAGGLQGDFLDGGLGMDYADYSASNTGVSVNLNTKAVSGGHAQGDTISNLDGVIGSAFNDTLVGYDQQSTVPGDSYTNVFFGGAGNDSLDGAGGDDSLYGGADQDTILGGTGNDLLDGGTGNDQLAGGTGNDLIYGAEGEDSISADAGNDTVYGGDGNDTVSGVSGSNLIYGDAGNDQVFGGSGSDSVYGGTGNDRLEDTLGSNLLDGGVGADTILSGSGNDSLYGGDDADSITDAGGTNTIDAGAGNDTVSAGAGADSILGGSGADSITDAGGANTIDAGIGNDTVATGTGNDSIQGGDGDDRITDTGGANLIYGGSGNDSVQTAGGADTVYGGDGADSITDTGGANLIDAGTGNDTVATGTGNDTVYGGDGDDRITDAGGVNQLFGGVGNDSLVGGAGNDSLYGGSGEDVFTVGAGDYIDGGANNDRLDLTGLGPVRVLRDPNVAGSGTVEFLNAQRQVIGSLTYQNVETVVPCFTPGCRIATARGLVAVETLVVGDRVRVRDGGYAPLRWIGHRRLDGAALAARPELLPVRIAAGALGGGLPRRALVVSPQHRILFTGPACELLFGEAEVLVAAVHLVGLAGVERLAVDAVDYVHFMCDRHEVVKANGVWTESFQPGDQTLAGLDRAQRDELYALFPELDHAHHPLRQAARPTLRAHEVAALLGRAA
nr:Hint domain-containing protein [Gemmobacter straminiformis]